MKRTFIWFIVVTFVVAPALASAQTSQALVEQLRAQIEALQKQLNVLRESQSRGAVRFSEVPPATAATPVPQTSVSAAGQNIPAFTRDLYFGMRNDPDVTDLQEFLTDQGYYAGPITGNYFILTLQAVKKFQSSNGISPTGYFGPRSRAVASEIMQKLVGTICPKEEGCEGNILPRQELLIFTNSNLNGEVGTHFAATFQVSGGSGNYSIKTDGDIPPGLSWTRTYCPPGLVCTQVIELDRIFLAGTPARSGVFNVVIIAQEQRDCKKVPCPGAPGNVLPPARYGKASFTVVISDKTVPGQPPVIHGIKGPTQLKAGEEGIWTINASDPNNGSLSYSVIWGDEVAILKEQAAPSAIPFRQTATFSHAYQNPGVYTPVFRVVNDRGLEAKTSISVNVTPFLQSITIRASSDLTGAVNKVFQAGFGGFGGEPSYSWSITAGGLPPGLKLVDPPVPMMACYVDPATGISECPEYKQTSIWLRGTPTQAGTYKFELTAKDRFGNTGRATFVSVISPAVITPALSITTASLPAATINSKYEATVSASGGSGSYSWGISSGSLPPGLELHSGICVMAPCQAPASIFGGPTAAGTYSFTLEVSDGVQSASRSFTMIVSPAVAPSITVISPNGGETWEVGKSYSISWSATNAPSDAWVALFLNTGEFIRQGLPTSGSYSWTVPNSECLGDACQSPRPIRKDYKAEARLYKGQSLILGLSFPDPTYSPPTLLASDYSDAPFSIVAATSALPDLAISNFAMSPSIPTAGQSSTLNINIINKGTAAAASVPYSLQITPPLGSGGLSAAINTCYSSLAAGATCGLTFNVVFPSAGPYTIDLGLDASNQIQESDETNNQMSLTVTAVNPPTVQTTVKVLSPNGGEQWGVGKSYPITWSTNAGKVNIELWKGSSFVQHIAIGVLGSQGSYTWTVPSLTAGSDYKIIVSVLSADGTYVLVSDTSDAPFSIVGSSLGMSAPSASLAGILAAIQAQINEIAGKIKQLQR